MRMQGMHPAGPVAEKLDCKESMVMKAGCGLVCRLLNAASISNGDSCD